MDYDVKPCILFVGKFQLEISKSSCDSSYCVSCKEVDYSSDSCDSIYKVLLDFGGFHELCGQDAVTGISYRGYTLSLNISADIRAHTVLGTCNEINYESRSYLSNHLRVFPDAVDEYLNTKMKSQFSVTYNDFTLDVCQYDIFQGKCGDIGFVSGSPTLDDLVTLFRQRVDEFNNPVNIEYRGYELEVKRKQENNAWFVGTCLLLGKDWKAESATVSWIEKLFRDAVDEKEALFHIEKLQCQVMLKQKDLENYLKTRGYTFDSIRISNSDCPDCVMLYAIHPDYWDDWLKSPNQEFPKGKVVFIRQSY